MKRKNIIHLRISKRKFIKAQKRKKKPKSGRNQKKTINSDFQYKLLGLKHRSELYTFFKKESFFSLPPRKAIIKCPKRLSFNRNFDETIVFFKELVFHTSKTCSNLILDFKSCKEINIGPATLLQLILFDFFSFVYRFNEGSYKQIKKRITLIPSKSIKINKMLFALELIDEFKGMGELTDSTFLRLGLKTGQKYRSTYKENTKGKIITEIRKYINESLFASSVILNVKGVNNLDNLLSEILGNAEDHSKLNSYYVNGVAFKEIEDKQPVIEVNLAIINFGYSIYQGFQDTKHNNTVINGKMEKIYNHHLRQINHKNETIYTKETLYTLYSLQEGISRIKYLKDSRGNGTMNFINAFIGLGAYGNHNNHYKPVLNVISGRSVIKCDNKYAPYQKGKQFFLSLNGEQDWKKLPEEKQISSNIESFPGTILQVKIYLNKEYFEKILDEREEENNIKERT